jgi:hypothetical protein
VTPQSLAANGFFSQLEAAVEPVHHRLP